MDNPGTVLRAPTPQQDYIPAVGPPKHAPTTLTIVRMGTSHYKHHVVVEGVLIGAQVVCICGMIARGQWNAVSNFAIDHLRTAPIESRRG